MKGKRIGLVTWYYGLNYGSTLQAFALCRKLRNLGHKAVIIREFIYPLTLRNVKVNFFTRYGIKRKKPFTECPYPVKRQRFMEFFKKEVPSYLPFEPIRFALFRRRTDVFMTGSDQLWNCYDHFRGLEFLDFVHGVKKVSYATSIGTGNIPEEYQDAVRAYLSEYSHISVREKSAEQELKRVTGRDDIRTVLDPTFLLSAEEWREFASGAAGDLNLPDKYIFCYLLRKDFDYSEVIATVKSLTGVDNVILLPSSENPGISVPGCIRCENAGPKEFIKALDKAAFVLTDSFHGSALSINLGKQFANLKRFADDDPKSQNSRLYDLADLFGLKPRFLEDGFPETIDFKAVHRKLEALREDSVSYLKHIIE